ncbi:hypothetical protein FB446DRAFT_788110 [Lentinula raphanica]|nr:hypothetical protein FB446DRAFT_788110 [Lentinula raphanica]
MPTDYYLLEESDPSPLDHPLNDDGYLLDESDPSPLDQAASDVQDADGVSLGSSEKSTEEITMDLDDPDDPPTEQSSFMPDDGEGSEHVARTRPSSPAPSTPHVPGLPIISRRNDSRGAIHFSVNSFSSLPPKPVFVHSASSSSVLSSPPLARSNSRASVSGNSTPDLPRGPGGRYSTSQKGKGRVKQKPITAPSTSALSSPSLTANDGSSSRPKEKAAERNARYENNFTDVQHRLRSLEKELQDSKASIRLLEARLLAPTPQPSNTMSSSPSPPYPTPVPAVSQPAPRRRALIDRIFDGPILLSGPPSPPPYDDDGPGPHKRPRIVLDPGLSQAAILTAPARWHFHSSSASIISAIARWRELFAQLDHSQLLPLPALAQFAAQTGSSLQDDPVRVILFFDHGGLNLFMDVWNSYHNQLPELFDISIRRYSHE